MIIGFLFVCISNSAHYSIIHSHGQVTSVLLLFIYITCIRWKKKSHFFRTLEQQGSITVYRTTRSANTNASVRRVQKCTINPQDNKQTVQCMLTRHDNRTVLYGRHQCKKKVNWQCKMWPTFLILPPWSWEKADFYSNNRVNLVKNYSFFRNSES